MPGSETHRLADSKARSIRGRLFFSAVCDTRNLNRRPWPDPRTHAKNSTAEIYSSFSLHIGSPGHDPRPGSRIFGAVRRLHHQVFPAPLQFLRGSGSGLALSLGFQARLGRNDRGGFPGSVCQCLPASDDAALSAQVHSAFRTSRSIGTHRRSSCRRLTELTVEEPLILCESSLRTGRQRLRIVVANANRCANRNHKITTQRTLPTQEVKGSSSRSRPVTPRIFPVTQRPSSESNQYGYSRRSS
jgi:hypothetical protein